MSLYGLVIKATGGRRSQAKRWWPEMVLPSITHRNSVPVAYLPIRFRQGRIDIVLLKPYISSAVR